MASTSCLQKMVAPLPPSDVQEMCACYFETHVSPMLKIIQHSQELMNKKLEDNYTTLQKAAEQQRRLKFEFGEFAEDSAGAVQELTAKVHQKADASDVARLAALLESKDGLSCALSEPRLANILKSKLTNAEEDNECLQGLLDAAMKQLESVSAAKAVDVEAHVLSDAAMWQQVEPDLEEPPLDKEFTFLSDDSIADSTQDFAQEPEEPPLKSEFSFPSDESTEDSTQDSTQEPCFWKRCTQQLHCEIEASLQQDRVAMTVERCQERVAKNALPWMAEQDDRWVKVCIIATGECDRPRDKFEEAQMAWHHARSCQVAKLPGSLRAALAEEDEALQQVKPIGQDSSKSSLPKILNLRFTNTEEENERLEQAREDLSKKYQESRSMIDTTESI